MAFRLGVDAGGTFNDLRLFDAAEGRFVRHEPHQPRMLPPSASCVCMSGMA